MPAVFILFYFASSMDAVCTWPWMLQLEQILCTHEAFLGKVAGAILSVKPAPARLGLNAFCHVLLFSYVL